MLLLLFTFSTSLVNWTSAQSSEEFFFHYQGKALTIDDIAFCEDGGVVFCLTKDLLQTYIIVKVDSNRELSWSKEFDVPEGTSGFKPTISSKGNNVYLSLADRINSSMGSYIAKLSENGDLVWSKKWYLPNHDGRLFDYPKKPIITKANELLLLQGLDNYSQVLKLSQDGALIFSKEIGNDTMTKQNPGFDFRTTADGGYIMTSKTGDKCVITKMTSNLEKEWSKRFNFDSNNHPKAVFEMRNGNFMIGGYAKDNNENHCFFTYVVDPNGKLLHSNYYISYFYPNQISYDGENIRFSCQYGITGVLNEKGEILSYSKVDQNFYNYSFDIKKLNNSVMSFDDKVLYYQNFHELACVESFDIIPLKDNIVLNTKAQLEDISLFVENEGVVEPYKLNFKASSGLSFEKACGLVDEEESGTPIQDSLALVLPSTQESIATYGKLSRMTENPLVYPNPFGTEIFVRNAENYSYYQVYSSNGELLKEGRTESTGIDLSELNTGVYFLNLLDVENRFTRIKMIKQ